MSSDHIVQETQAMCAHVCVVVSQQYVTYCNISSIVTVAYGTCSKPHKHCNNNKAERNTLFKRCKLENITSLSKHSLFVQ